MPSPASTRRTTRQCPILASTVPIDHGVLPTVVCTEPQYRRSDSRHLTIPAGPEDCNGWCWAFIIPAVLLVHTCHSSPSAAYRQPASTHYGQTFPSDPPPRSILALRHANPAQQDASPKSRQRARPYHPGRASNGTSAVVWSVSALLSLLCRMRIGDGSGRCRRDIGSAGRRCNSVGLDYTLRTHNTPLRCKSWITPSLGFGREAQSHACGRWVCGLTEAFPHLLAVRTALTYTRREQENAPRMRYQTVCARCRGAERGATIHQMQAWRTTGVRVWTIP